MTNATETTKTLAEQISEATAKLDTAKSNRDKAMADFQSMLAAGVNAFDGDINKQLEVSEAARRAPGLVDSAEALLKSLQSRQKIETLDKPTAALRDALKTRLDRDNFAEILKSADAGNVVSFVCTYNIPEGQETGTWTISSAFKGVSTPRAASATSGTGGARSRKVYVTPEGEFDSTKAYVEKYFAAAKAAGYSTSRESADVVPANEYSKVAVVIADKLGHTIRDA